MRKLKCELIQQNCPKIIGIIFAVSSTACAIIVGSVFVAGLTKGLD